MDNVEYPQACMKVAEEDVEIYSGCIRLCNTGYVVFVKDVWHCFKSVHHEDLLEAQNVLSSVYCLDISIAHAQKQKEDIVLPYTTIYYHIRQMLMLL